MRLLNAHILAGNAKREWHADSGKPRRPTFILCVKKYEWVYSSASTSFKNPLLVRVRPMCSSVKLHLCRLLFMQYKITWHLIHKRILMTREHRNNAPTTIAVVCPRHHIGALNN